MIIQRNDMIKVGDQVITSKGRYGRVIEIDSKNQDEPKYLIKIGTKNHWILESQLTSASHTIRVKVIYQIDYCGKFIEDSLEIAIKKDTILYEDGVSKLHQICKDKIEKQLNIEAKIKQIKIS